MALRCVSLALIKGSAQSPVMIGLWCTRCRFAKQTLETGGNADATLESADAVYVYDYCYMMKQVADSSSQRHWLLKDIYNGTRGQGELLLKLYRSVGCDRSSPLLNLECPKSALTIRVRANSVHRLPLISRCISYWVYLRTPHSNNCACIQRYMCSLGGQ